MKAITSPQDFFLLISSVAVNTASPCTFIENEGITDYEVRKMKDVDSEVE